MPGQRCVCVCVHAQRSSQRFRSRSAWMQPTILERVRWRRGELSQWGVWVWEKTLYYVHVLVWVCVSLPHPSVNPLSFTSLSYHYTLALIAAGSEATWFALMLISHFNNFVSNPVFMLHRATNSLQWPTLIEFYLNCRSRHHCLLLWKITCCSSPLTSFRDKLSAGVHFVHVLTTAPICICVCAEAKLGVCECVCMCVCPSVWAMIQSSAGVL